MPAVLVKRNGRCYLFLFGEVNLEEALRVVDRAKCGYYRLIVVTDKKNRYLGRRLRWALALP